MGRVLGPLVRPLFSSKKILSELFHSGDHQGFLEAFRMLWNDPAMRQLQAQLDEATTGKPGGFTYRRSSLYGIHFVAQLLGVPAAAARRIVQGDPVLRRTLGFQPVGRTKFRRLRRAAGRDEIREPGFPSPQTVSDLSTRWAATSGFPVEERTREAAAAVAIAAILDHDLDTTRAALDGTVVLSPNRRSSSKRPDDGSGWLTRSDQKSKYGRQRMAGNLMDTGLVLWSSIESPRGESPHAQDLLHDLERFDRKLRANAAARGIVGHPGLRGAAVFGDSAFANTPFAKALIERGFEPCLDVVGQGSRELSGDIALKLPGGGVAVYDLSNDGLFFCECDRYENALSAQPDAKLRKTPLARRSPMTQYKGVSGKYGHIACKNPTCARQHLRVYFPMGVGPDKVQKGVRSRGDENFVITQTLPRYETRVPCMMFLGRQVNERNHSYLERHGLLGKVRHSKRRRIYGKTAHGIWYALGDLCLNLTIAHNLATLAEPRRVFDEDELIRSKNSNAAAVRARKQALANNRRRTSFPPRAKAPPRPLAVAS